MAAEGAGIWDGLRVGRWLTAGRVSGYWRLLACANLLGLGLAVCRAHGWFLPLEPHVSIEFMSFYAAGRLVNAGQALAVYLPGMAVGDYIASYNGPPGFVAMQQALAGDPHVALMGFYYPPVFWLICAPLAHLGFYPAYFLWAGVTLLAFLAVLHRLGGWGFVWPVLGCMSVVKNVAVGENACLSAALIGFGLLNLERRPWVAGALFGCVCYKPHFLLPLGVFLLAGQQWRALAGMALAAGGLCGLAGLVFGWQAWVDYFQITVPHAEWMFQHHGISYGLQVTPFASVMLLGGGVWLGNAVQMTSTLVAMIAVAAAARWGRCNVKAAILLASFPLMLSVMLDYDLTLSLLAMVFLVREARIRGFLAWEKTTLATMFVLPFIILLFRTNLHVPVDELVIVGFMVVLLARLRHDARRVA